jgi:beta/gamma crystallin
MLRAILVGVSLLALCAEPSLAETVRDTQNNFRVSVPSGWKADKYPAEDLKVVLAAPDREQTGANCNVVTEAHPPSKAMTQAQIDADIDAQVNEAAWSAMFKSVIFIDNVVVEKSGTERLNGHNGHFVVVSFASVTPGMPIRQVKLKQDLIAIPGELFFVTCSASQDAYAQKEDEFKSVFESFAPLNDSVATIEPSGVPSLTLYARSNFDGVSRVVTRDTPDLALTGWRDPAGSVSIAGPGLWQVCDGANYSGSCRLVSGSSHEPMTVVSARLLPARQTSFGLLLQAGGAQGARTSLRR